MEKSKAEQAFLEVLNKHKKILYKIINLYCKDREDRLDLEQEIIIQLWKSFNNYDSSYQYSTFIYRIALNVSISFYRKDKTRKQKSAFYDNSIFQISDDSDSQYQEEEMTYLYKIIEQLDKLNKALLILHLEGRNYKEIAMILGISESNVGTKLNRIRQTLKEKFQKIEQ